MQNYKCNVPVKIQIWTRPKLQKLQFDIIKKVKPKVIFLASDGGRNKQECDLINFNRNYLEKSINWKCTVYKLYQTKNIGIYGMSKFMHQQIWSKVDRCIMFEDDHLPSVSYFKFCEDLLEKYKDDERISFINGVNLQGKTQDCPFDYFFARHLSISGYATWKRTYKYFGDLSYKKYPYIIELLKKLSFENKYSKNTSHFQQIKTYVDNKYCFGHVPADEFFLTYTFFGRHQLAIVPKVNMISNMGVGEDSEHSDNIKNIPKSLQKIFLQKIYEIKFPLKHNDFILPNLFYEQYRNKLFALDNPIKYYYRRFIRLLLLIKNNGVKTGFDKLHNFFIEKYSKNKLEK